jgi:phosphatidylserine/phosphatidylglycerophosphate/cardiolipin synthase-like enzyme
MLLADGCRAIVGSINLTPGSFDDRRELAIEVHDVEIVERLHEIAHYDWKNSHPLDLTDKGLFEDLEIRRQGGSEILILNIDSKKKENKNIKSNCVIL